MNNFQSKSLSDSEVNLGAKSDILRYEVRIAHFVPLSLSQKHTHTFSLSPTHAHSLPALISLSLCLLYTFFLILFHSLNISNDS